MGKGSLALGAVIGSTLLLTASTGGSARPEAAFEFTVAVDGVPDPSFSPGEAEATGDPTVVQWTGTHESPGAWSFGSGYHATADDDQRRVTLASGFVNLSDETHTYTITFRAPVDGITGRSWMTGLVAGSLNDSNISGHAAATSDDDGGCVGLADGRAVMHLLQAMNAEVNEPGGGLTFADSHGMPPGTVPGPRVGSDLGLTMSFTLTPGDSVGINASFLVVN